MRKNVWKALLLATFFCFAGCQENEETQIPVTNIPEITKEAEETTNKTKLPDAPEKTDGTEGKEKTEPTKGAEGTKAPETTEAPALTEVPKPTKEAKPTETAEATATPASTAIPKPTETAKPTAIPKPTATPKPTKAPTTTGMPAPTMAPEALQTLMKNDNVLNVKQGDVVFLGRYEQDGDASNGPEDIEWYVVGREKNKALLMSKYILDCVEYDDREADVSWEDSALRKWLMLDFSTDAFTLDEWGYVEYSELENNGNSYLNVPGEGKTTDSVFVLSIDELEKYTPASAYDDFEWYWFGDRYYEWLDEGEATEYAKQNGAFVWPWENDDIYNHGNWWLRSPGKDNTTAMFYNFSGFVDLEGSAYNTDDVGVRPAIWVDLEAMADDMGISREPEDKPEEAPEAGKEKESGSQFNSENVFSFEEVTFMGISMEGLTLDRAEEALKKAGLTVKREEKISIGGEAYTSVTGGYNEWLPAYMVRQDATDDIVTAWSVENDYFTKDKEIPVGVRDVCLFDTLGKVLVSLGYEDGYRIETTLKDVIGKVSEDAWFGGEDLEEAEEEICELFSAYNTQDMVILAVVASGDYISLTFDDYSFDAKDKTKMHSYMMDFCRSEEYNGEFALESAFMSIYIVE